jgi:hypothetical protein
MPQLFALSLSIAVLGAVWAFLALGPLSGHVLVWAGFIAWGCFFHSGADKNALSKTISGTCYGALIGWIALLIIVNVAMPPLAIAWRRRVVSPVLPVIVASLCRCRWFPQCLWLRAAIVAFADR